jgi:CheY-like chemotaxis protein/two-component sensor histidine kinase
MVRDAEVINLGGKRLLKLLTNVLDLARLEAGKTKLQVTGHELGESLSRTVDLLRVLAVNKGLTLTLSIEPGLLVAGDLQAEEQIWNNLIGNAIKFTEKGGVTVEAYRQNELAAMVVIRDTGIGIGSAFLPHIFEEFRQESEGLGRQYEGTGLGLTITKRLVEALDGTISVASEEGHGTTVTVSLPLAIKESPPESMALTEAQPPVSPLPPPLKILAVEDDPSTSRLIVRVLKDIGHVTTCQTSEEVLATARAEKFDLILIDINLKGSGMNGLDVRRLLRALPGYRRTPMVAVTAYAMDGDEQRFLAGGFDGYLAKPFDANELKNLVLRVAQSLPETELR